MTHGIDCDVRTEPSKFGNTALGCLLIAADLVTLGPGEQLEVLVCAQLTELARARPTVMPKISSHSGLSDVLLFSSQTREFVFAAFHFWSYSILVNRESRFAASNRSSLASESLPIRCSSAESVSVTPLRASTAAMRTATSPRSSPRSSACISRMRELNSMRSSASISPTRRATRLESAIVPPAEVASMTPQLPPLHPEAGVLVLAALPAWPCKSRSSSVRNRFSARSMVAAAAWATSSAMRLASARARHRSLRSSRRSWDKHATSLRSISTLHCTEATSAACPAAISFLWRVSVTVESKASSCRISNSNRSFSGVSKVACRSLSISTRSSETASNRAVRSASMSCMTTLKTSA
mmetsp:Transcript_29477/g.57769  ORF Transcript_29477/g.57769 Transcript_29477/m.57769 type:complete len:354 (-) Transcript_29477:197-1258(-)